MYIQKSKNLFIFDLELREKEEFEDIDFIQCTEMDLDVKQYSFIPDWMKKLADKYLEKYEAKTFKYIMNRKEEKHEIVNE